MQEFIARAKTLPDAYHLALHELHNCGAITDSEDWNTRVKECGMTICVSEPLSEPMISKCFIGGPKELQQYVMEMLDGILDFEVLKGLWNYTYHKRMVWPANQIRFVVDELRRCPSSRRAVINVRNGHDMGSSDPACLQHIQYFVRRGKLDCDVLFRSNDACKATFMNAFALVMLQRRLADDIGVEMGTYTHRANSFHAYERDWLMLESYAGRLIKGEDLAYSYEGDWKEMMDESISEIEAEVKELWER